MFRKRTRSTAIDVGLLRTTALQDFDEEFEFTEGFTKHAYNELVFQTLQELQKYNSRLQRADEQKRLFEDLESKLADANERVRAGIMSKFGRDSIEYTRLGGTRKSEISGYKPNTYIPSNLQAEDGEEEGEGEDSSED